MLNKELIDANSNRPMLANILFS